MSSNDKLSLKAARMEAGMRQQGRGFTQEQVAKALGIQRSTLSRWERGDSHVSGMARFALAYYYKMNADDFDLQTISKGD